MTTKTQAFYCILFATAIVAFSCESNRETASKNEQLKAIYLDQFKLAYFRQLLAKSYNNSKAVREIIGADHSGFTEPILTAADYHLIDSFTTIDNDFSIADSAKSNQRAEGAQGKRPLDFIMHKLSGKWLDSLANQRLKLGDLPDSWPE